MPGPRMSTRPRDLRDRLVFLESEYLRISSTKASWPETLFLFHAQTTRLVFAGLSMSDANIRRWMSASEADLSMDYEHVFSGIRLNPEHLWLTTRPSDPSLERLHLVSMSHLGVRPAWIDEWKDLERNPIIPAGWLRSCWRVEPTSASDTCTPTSSDGTRLSMTRLRFSGPSSTRRCSPSSMAQYFGWEILR